MIAYSHYQKDREKTEWTLDHFVQKPLRSMDCREFWQELALDKDGLMNTKREQGGSDPQWLATN